MTIWPAAAVWHDYCKYYNDSDVARRNSCLCRDDSVLLYATENDASNPPAGGHDGIDQEISLPVIAPNRTSPWCGPTTTWLMPAIFSRDAPPGN